MKLTKNQKLYYTIGGIAILGIGYYFWDKNRKSLAETMSTGGSASTGGGGGGGGFVGGGSTLVDTDTDSTQDVVDNEAPTDYVPRYIGPVLRAYPLELKKVEVKPTDFSASNPSFKIGTMPLMPSFPIVTNPIPQKKAIDTVSPGLTRTFSANGRRTDWVGDTGDLQERTEELQVLN